MSRELLGEDLWALILEEGALGAAREVTTLPSPRLSRRAWRLELEDGRTLKGRRLEDASESERVHRISSLLGAELCSPVLRRRGAALLEAWIDGPTADDLARGPELFERAGRFLARVHARSEAASGEPPSDELERRVRALAELRLATAAQVDALLERARASTPPGADRGAVHGDLALENLVALPSGDLISIDSSSFDVGLYDLDLAQAWYRMAMSPGELDRFLFGYGALRDPTGYAAHADFWNIFALSSSALFRVLSATGGSETPLALLLPLAGA